MRLPLNVRMPVIRNQALIGTSLFFIAVFSAYQVAGKILTDDVQTVVLIGAGLVGCTVVVSILRDWRGGMYWFIGWLTFEDLLRKYMGNGLILFFGKDILAGFVYISLFIAIRKGKEKIFRPPFMIFLSLFFWLGVIQIFNAYSPSIWFGLLGIKTYFYYIPLMYAGYAFARSDEDLRKFLTWNIVLAGIVASIGIIQSVAGNSFMNPANLAPELRELGDLQKATPLSNQAFNLPDSVFVSSGRYTQYLIIAAVLALGTAGYLLLYTKRSRKLTFIVTGLIGVGVLLSGSRGCLLYGFGSAIVLAVGFLWGAPWRQRQAHRMVKAIRWSAALICFGAVAFFAVFPQAMGSRLAYYSETLLPSSSSYELSYRSWDYPVQNLLGAFTLPNWVVGNGIGTASLGGQYVAKLTGQPFGNTWVEEGYGNMIVEMGILGPILWLLWTCALMWFTWQIVRRLRETRYFPLALAVFWYAFILLFPMTFGGLAPYQDYTCNAYLWLLIGITYRLPDLALTASAAPALEAQGRSSYAGGFQF